MQELYYRCKTWLVSHWQWFIVVALMAGFFVLASAYNQVTQRADFVKWSSPDETANYFLTKLYAETGGLTYTDQDNLYAGGIIMPRSLRTDGSLVKPVSFLGMILLYGQIASFVGVEFIPYLTPALAALGLLFFYLIVRRLFKSETALVATVLLAAFPVYWYFSARSMFHNVPFVVLWVAGLYFALRMTETRATLQADWSGEEKKRHYLTWLWSALAGLLMGAAVTVRSSELLWLLPLLGVLWVFNFYRLGVWRPMIFVYFFALALAPIMFWNTVLYGGPLASGYPKLAQSISGISSSTAQIAQASVVADHSRLQMAWEALKQSVFTFGFNAGHSRDMAYQYIYKMFGWLVLAASLGFIALIWRTETRRKTDLIYVIGLGVLSVILIFYYGSWVFYDNPDPNSFTIGNSYTRYWLPIYLGLLPLAALIIVRASNCLKWRPAVWLARVLVLTAIVYASVYFTLYGSEEGLVPSARRQLIARNELKSVLALTPPEAVIITRYHDKLVWPERRVIMGLLTDQRMNELYARLVLHSVPVFYYNFSFSEQDLAYLNSSKLAPLGIKMDKIRQITKDFTLYQLKVVE
jgi:4-amino-4-deoxy-L-arabinose transferase-like glycosyltransferase